MLYTIGSSGKSAEEFFNLIKNNNIDIIIDIRLNNTSQLSGFSKRDDLEYFLREISGTDYKHALEFAPSPEIFNGFRKKEIEYIEFKTKYTNLMEKRGDYKNFNSNFKYNNPCLLCSELEPDLCHRKILGELIVEISKDRELVHL